MKLKFKVTSVTTQITGVGTTADSHIFQTIVTLTPVQTPGSLPAGLDGINGGLTLMLPGEVGSATKYKIGSVVDVQI